MNKRGSYRKNVSQYELSFFVEIASAKTNFLKVNALSIVVHAKSIFISLAKSPFIFLQYLMVKFSDVPLPIVWWLFL